VLIGWYDSHRQWIKTAEPAKPDKKLREHTNNIGKTKKLPYIATYEVKLQEALKKRGHGKRGGGQEGKSHKKVSKSKAR
jgi:hypothetical protein